MADMSSALRAAEPMVDNRCHWLAGDERAGRIDPIPTAVIEKLKMTLRGTRPIVVVTHPMMESGRVANRVAPFHLGRLVAVGAMQDGVENAQHDLRILAGTLGRVWPPFTQ